MNTYENSNISRGKNIIFKKSSGRNQNPSTYYYSITNLKFEHKPKVSSSKKSSHKIRPIITQGPKYLKLLYFIVNLDTISLPTKGRPAKENPQKLQNKRHESKVTPTYFQQQTNCMCELVGSMLVDSWCPSDLQSTKIVSLISRIEE